MGAVSERDLREDAAVHERLRREGEASRNQRTGCPDPDLLLARRSEALEAAVRARLEQHLTVCEDCSRFARDFDALNLDEADEAIESRVLARIRPATRAGLSRWLGVAAGIVITAGVATLWWTRPLPAPGPDAVSAPIQREPSATGSPAQTDMPPTAALWTIEPAPVRVPLTSLGVPRNGSGTDAGAAAALIEALAPYQRGDFDLAVDRLEQFVRQHPDQSDAYLYLGVSCLMADRPSSAVVPLERARSLASPNRRAEIDWYLATAEQRSGRVDASRARLRELCAGQSRYRALSCAAAGALE
jgi:hypothetical protein